MGERAPRIEHVDLDRSLRAHRAVRDQQSPISGGTIVSLWLNIPLGVNGITKGRMACLWIQTRWVGGEGWTLSK
jgi:hypothetical protein